MSKRYLITLPEPVAEMLEGIMKDEHRTFPSPIVHDLIVEEMKRRKNAKKTVARAAVPLAADQVAEEDEERTIPHPDQVMNKGVLLTRSEYDSYMEIKGSATPGSK